MQNHVAAITNIWSFIKIGFRQFMNSTPVLLSMAMLFAFSSFFSAYFYTQFFGAYYASHTPEILFVALYSFFVFFVLPVIFSRLFLNESIKTMGLAFPKDKMKTLFWIVFSLILLAPLIFYIAKQKQIHNYYLFQDPDFFRFLLIHLFLFPFYYLGEEFFFRGFIFLNLWKKVGWHSFWITDLIFVWIHFNKPLPEFILSIPAGILLNFITLKTKSIFPAMVVHTTIAVILNVLVNFQIVTVSW